MTSPPDDMSGSAADHEVVSRLRSAAAWAGSLAWRLDASDVMGGAALAPSVPGRTERRAPVRLRPRVAWAALVAAAIAAAVVVPQISSHTHSAGGTGTTSSTVSPSKKGGGSEAHSAAACTTTVDGVAVWNGSAHLVSKDVVVQLPVSPGPIISRSEAISIARDGVPRTTTVAKLSSWSEVSALLYTSEPGIDEPATLGAGAYPWAPVWTLMLSTQGSHGPSGHGPYWHLVVMVAATGKIGLQMQIGDFPAWFSSLSDRDPTLKGCPGGSSARLPFGVLTRDEEAFTVHAEQPPGTQAILTLTTVPALDHADPGLYGGCVHQSCSLDELVWPLFLVYKAAPGHTLACLPPSASYPPGYRPKQVKEYYTLSVSGNEGIGCGPIPSALANLKDLAPPAG